MTAGGRFCGRFENPSSVFPAKTAGPAENRQTAFEIGWGGNRQSHHGDPGLFEDKTPGGPGGIFKK